MYQSRHESGGNTTFLKTYDGQSTPDGKFYLKVEEECLAACCGAPMMMIDHVYHENLTPKSVDEILEAVKD